MSSARRRLEAIEGKTRPRASPGERPLWRTPAEEAAREEGFRQLYAQLGVEPPPAPKNREEAFAELFEEIAAYREGTYEGT